MTWQMWVHAWLIWLTGGTAIITQDSDSARRVRRLLKLPGNQWATRKICGVIDINKDGTVPKGYVKSWMPVWGKISDIK